jgi:tetraacyldisaccharide 4'-kinase
MSAIKPRGLAWQQALQQSWHGRGWLSTALRPLSGLYGALMALRRLSYRRGWLHTTAPARPLVVVGNVVVGGAGKTPTVVALVRALQAQGWRCGVVSRGHGGRNRSARLVEPDSLPELVGDEPLLIRLRAACPVVVSKRRLEAVHCLLARHPEVDVVISDDGLQHWALGRSAEIVVFDERGLGNGLLLPAGPLRERPESLAPGMPRWVLYNAERATTPWPGHLMQRRFTGLTPLATWSAGEIWPWEQGLSTLKIQAQGLSLWAAAGIAHPQRFFTALAQAGVDVQHELPLPDHDPLLSPPWPAQGALTLVTEKDAVKLQGGQPPHCDRLRTHETSPPHLLNALPHGAARATQVWVVTLEAQLPPELLEQLAQALGLPPQAPHVRPC